MVFDASKNRDVKKYDWEIDLMGTGSQTVLPTSIHPVTGQAYRWEREIDFVFPCMMAISATTQERLGARADAPATSDAGDDDENCLETILAAQPLDLTSDQANEILSTLPDDWVEDRGHWLTVGAALHRQFEGQRDAVVGPLMDWRSQLQEGPEQLECLAWINRRTVVSIIGNSPLNS